MSNDPNDNTEHLQPCPMHGCDGEAVIDEYSGIVTCSKQGCILWYNDNAVTVEVWEALPRYSDLSAHIKALETGSATEIEHRGHMRAREVEG